jgi:dimethylglycine dehydrogenase
VISDSEAAYYSRQEGNGLLLGAYEKTCHHWAIDGTPLDFGHELLPDDLERMEVNFEIACSHMPALARTGVKRVINGPMIFSPDLGPLLGPHPDLKNYICACGVMTGFNQSGGIGKTIAEWIIEGEPELDVNFWDVARFGKWAGRKFTFERTRYYYENRQERPFPHLENASGRPARTFPAYDLQAARGAVFGLNNGWEQPLWFAREGDEPRDIYSYTRQIWFEAVGEECRNVRKNAGLFEISTFAKYLVTGANARAWLERVLAGRIPKHIGRVALCPMLSPKGRLAGDLTVTQTGAESFMLLGAGTMQGQHMRWFRAHAMEGAVVKNLSDTWAGLMIAGSRSREVLERIAWREDVSNEAFGFLSARSMDMEGMPDALCLRVSFTGELGYEIYGPAEYQRGLYSAILQAGEGLGLAPAGSRALSSLRIEKGFASWGLDLGSDYSVMEPGLDWAVDWSRDDYIGAEASKAARAAPRQEVFTSLVIEADDADCTGGEPVFQGDTYVGYVSSGAWGHTLGASVALGYIRPEAHEVGAAVEVEINGVRRPGRIARSPLHDPEGTRMRA